MLECEIKLLEIDKQHVVDMLTQIGATCIWEKMLVDVYLDGYKMLSWWLPFRARIRFGSDGKSVLTCKYKLSAKHTKQAFELEFNLPLWFSLSLEQRLLIDHIRIKKRMSWSWSGYVFDLDEYVWLPPLLEIEWPNEKSIQTVIHLLWFTKYTQFTQWAKSLYDAYAISLPAIEYWFFARLISLIRCW